MVNISTITQSITQTKRQRNIDLNKIYYKKYSQITIECRFCRNITNLTTIHRHLKNSKKCMSLQAIELLKNPNILDNIYNDIHNIKQEEKYKDYLN